MLKVSATFSQTAVLDHNQEASYIIYIIKHSKVLCYSLKLLFLTLNTIGWSKFGNVVALVDLLFKVASQCYFQKPLLCYCMLN